MFQDIVIIFDFWTLSLPILSFGHRLLKMPPPGFRLRLSHIVVKKYSIDFTLF